MTSLACCRILTSWLWGMYRIWSQISKPHWFLRFLSWNVPGSQKMLIIIRETQWWQKKLSVNFRLVSSCQEITFITYYQELVCPLSKWATVSLTTLSCSDNQTKKSWDGAISDKLKSFQLGFSLNKESFDLELKQMIWDEWWQTIWENVSNNCFPAKLIRIQHEALHFQVKNNSHSSQPNRKKLSWKKIKEYILLQQVSCFDFQSRWSLNCTQSLWPRPRPWPRPRSLECCSTVQDHSLQFSVAMLSSSSCLSTNENATSGLDSA